MDLNPVTEQQRQQNRLLDGQQESAQSTVERWKMLAAHGQEYANKKRMENEAREEQKIKETCTFKPYVGKKSQMLSQNSRIGHWAVGENDNVI